MSTPSKPVNIRSPKLGPTESDEALNAQATPIGTPDLRALRAQYVGTPPPPNIPPRGTPGPPRNGSPAISSVGLPPVGVSVSPSPRLLPIVPPSRRSETPLQVPQQGVSFGATEAIPPLSLEDLPDEEKARVLRRHLVSKGERQGVPGGVGGTRAEGSSTPSSRRSSQLGPRREDSEPFPIPYHAPGADVTHDIYKWHSDQQRAGEDLEDDEEEDKEDDEEEAFLPSGGDLTSSVLSEHTPLMGGTARTRSRSRRRRMSVEGHGNATVTQAVLMLLKSFVGTGVLFLGKAFYNGGMVFSAVTFVFIALISLYSFLLLVDTKFVVSGSFGDIGGTLYGPWMRYMILGSIIISQLGFVGAYIIFVSENLQAFVMGITNCAKLLPVQYFILMQLVVFLPLSLVRDIAKLSTTALIADAFILAGLCYIFGSEFSILAQQGVADIKLFNPRDFPLFIGTAVFSFEGIGLVIPITDAMREPHKFPKVLTGVMIGLIFLFGGAGALAYLTFGSEIQTVVLVNLNGESKMVQSVQFLYSLAIMLSVPLQLFPAIRIMENGMFVRSGKSNPRVKWLKNAFRFFTVFVCAAISWFGASDLDKFVAFVGCFAWFVAYIFGVAGSMLHYKAVARTRVQKLKDIAMIVFGLVAAAYTTIQTVKLMIEPDAGGSPKFGHCEIPSN
ncbi:hypothetical protein ONZ45_g1461 [Pleurotus djamor]|nr:hypothetical protein ONZ45_g1461 [Pleurotus djamor]